MMGADGRQELLSGEEGVTGRRSASRVRLALPARLETIRGVSPVTLVNLSRTGAQIAAQDTPSVGSDVVLKCGAVDAFALVTWVRDGHCGLHFEEPIGHAELLMLRQSAEEAVRTPNAAELRAARDWAVGR